MNYKILEEKEEWIGTERFVDFLLTAYTPRKKEVKLLIYEILNDVFGESAMIRK